MPCRDGCSIGVPTKETRATDKGFDAAGALCDLLSLLENKFPAALKEVDLDVIAWWTKHSKEELVKIKKEALAKLNPREKRALGLK